MSDWTNTRVLCSRIYFALFSGFAFRLTVSFKTSRSLDPLREHKDILRSLSAYADKAKIEKVQMYMQVVGFFSELLNIKEIKTPLCLQNETKLNNSHCEQGASLKVLPNLR